MTPQRDTPHPAGRVIRLFAALCVLLSVLWVPAMRHAAAHHVAAGVVIDDQRTTIILPHTPVRLISLAPSATEMLYALELGPQIVGVSSYNTYPPAAAKKEIVLTYSGMKTERIVALHPDLIVANVGIASPAQILKLRHLHLKVLVLNPRDLPGIFHDIQLLGLATGKYDVALSLSVALQARVGAVVARVARAKQHPRVFYEVDSTGGYWTAGAGSFVDSLIHLAGGVNVADATGVAYPKLNAEQVIRANPDVIVLGDAAYGTSAATVAKRPGWSIIGAVVRHHIVPFNDDLASRPGPRIVDGLERMAAILHPDLFPRH